MYSQRSIRGLTKGQLENIPLGAFSGLSYYQLFCIPAEAFGGLTKEQLYFISAESFEGLTISQLNNIPDEAFGGLEENTIKIIKNNMRYFNKKNLLLYLSFVFIPPILAGSSFKITNSFDRKNKKILLGVLAGACCGSYFLHQYRTSKIRKVIKNNNLGMNKIEG